MSKCATFLSWVMFVALMIVHERADASPTEAQDRNRAVTTYDYSTDRCRRLHSGSLPEEKSAADSFCKQAFEALDRLQGNACEGYSSPECRLFPKAEMYLCSCKVPPPEKSKVRGLRFSTFHDCAWKLKEEEARNKKTPAPSESFKLTHAKVQKKAEKRAKAWRTGKTPSEAEESTDSEEERYFQRNVGINLKAKEVSKFSHHFRVEGGGASRESSNDFDDSSSDSLGDEAESGGKDSRSIVSGVKNLWGRISSSNKGSSTASTAARRSNKRQKTKGKQPK